MMYRYNAHSGGIIGFYHACKLIYIHYFFMKSLLTQYLVCVLVVPWRPRYVYGCVCVYDSQWEVCPTFSSRYWKGMSLDKDRHCDTQVDVATETEAVYRAQTLFLEQWVTAIPSPTLLSLVLLEAERLGVAQQQHAKKSQQSSGEIEAAESSVDTQAVYMQIAMDLQSGAITTEEYGDLIAAQTLKVTFQYLVLEKSKKEDILLRCVQTQKSHPLLKEDPVFKSLLPSLVLSTSFGLSSCTDVAVYIEKPLAYIEMMNKYKQSFSPRDKIMYDTFMYCSHMLSGSSSEQKMFHQWVEDLVDTCISENLSTDEVIAERGALSQRISNLCSGKVDIQRILESQIELWLGLPDENLAEVLECGLSIALALIQQSENRSLLFSGLPGFVSRVSNPLSGSCGDVNVPLFVFQELENKFNQVLTPVFKRLHALKDQYVPSLHGSMVVDGGEYKAILLLMILMRRS